MSRDIFFSFFLALSIHSVVLAFFHQKTSREAQILLNQGESAIRLTLQPTQESSSETTQEIIEPPKAFNQANKKAIKRFASDIKNHLINFSKSFVKPRRFDSEESKLFERKTEVDKEISQETPEPVDQNQIISQPQEADLLTKGVMAKAYSTSKIRPVYPLASKRRGEEGLTIYLVEILASGDVRTIQLVKSSGYKRLDVAALDALKKADYFPALQDGQPVASKKTFQVRFEIEDLK